MDACTYNRSSTKKHYSAHPLPDKAVPRNFKSQSAMEYLMTYGWAILIIAIVLAAMFTLGVFSSPVGTTCRAFPGFVCTAPVAHGNTFTATMGQAIGTNWYNVTLCFVPASPPTTPSSCSGYSSEYIGTLPNDVSGTYSIPISSSTGTQSGYIWAQYTLNGQPGIMTRIAVATMSGLTPGTVSTSSTSTIPSGIVAYAPITLNNAEATATPAPFQQMVNITESSYSSYLAYNNNLANFEYFYHNGTIIPSWIESNTTGKLITWINLKSGIPASSNTIIYVGFASKSTNLLSNSGTSGIGEAPQLPSTYAQYDDGSSVFNNYWNFAGTSLPSGWTTAVDGSVSINNGLTLTSTYNWGGVASGSINANPPIILDAYETVTTEQATALGFSTATTFSSTYSYYDSYQYLQAGSNTFTYGNIGEGTGTGQTGIATGTLPIASNLGYNVYSESFTASGVSQSQNYVAVDSGASSFLSSASYAFASVYEGATQKIQWLRTRAYPPNGVMPSVSLGTIQN